MRRNHHFPWGHRGINVSSEDMVLPSCHPMMHWSFRMLMTMDGIAHFISSAGEYMNPDVACALGLPPVPNWDDVEQGAAMLVRAMRLRHQEISRHVMDYNTLPEALEGNLAMLGRQFLLNGCEIKVLRFAVLLHSHEVLQVCSATLGELSTGKLIRALGVLLDEPMMAIKEALALGGKLDEMGFIKVDRRDVEMSYKLEIPSQDLVSTMLLTVKDPMLFFRNIILRSPGSSLNLSHYRHMAGEVSALRHILTDALESARLGSNVFLYGPPGTGKSELARLLGRMLKARTFEVSSENMIGDPIGGVQRLHAWRAAQTLLQHREDRDAGALLIFDEAEDVFGGDTAQRMKAWMNRSLEGNPVPTVWISNSIKGLDPAFVRRFEMFCEVKGPTRNQRLAMARAMTEGVATDELVKRIAACEPLTQAVLQRAMAVSERVAARRKDGTEKQALLLERLLDGTLRAQGHGGLQPSLQDVGRGYDPAFIHADADLEAVARGLKAQRAARICLYGPPGTGKSAFVHHLARQLHLPLMELHASDLLDPLVGMTERRLAVAFTEARQRGALLLLDEVDSFLLSRSGATQNWQVTMVNEMLTQMEHFEGLFVATTNLMDGLDAAAMRRFDLKVRFDYLLGEQAAAMFRAFCSQHGICQGVEEAAAEVARLKSLTPGDFAAIARRHRFASLSDGQAVLEALRRECALKPGGGRPMGF